MVSIRDQHGRVLYSADHASERDAMVRAVKDGVDLSGAILTESNLAGALLAGAKLNNANLGSADLTGADLTGAFLIGAKLPDARLIRAKLTGADLTNADLFYADLERADVENAILTNAELMGAGLLGVDLRKAKFGYKIPRIKNIDQKILDAIESGGGLRMADYHTCETAHCRAGWAIHLAGEKGYKLEAMLTSGTAGTLIYAFSRPGCAVPNFFAFEGDAIADIRACAAAQAGRKEGPT